MRSLVHDLQKEASDSTDSISNLLRKAYLVSRKLNVKDLETWLSKEINGYKKNDIVPDYRIVIGEVRAFNPYRGWIPVMLDENLDEITRKQTVFDSVAQLEHLMESQQDGILAIQLSSGIQRSLAELTNHDFEYQYFFSSSQVEKIFETVRNGVLEWSIKLEESGVLGENFSFTESEKEKAKSSSSDQTINIFNGAVVGSQFQQHSSNSTQTMSTGDINLEEVSNFAKRLNDQLVNLETTEQNKDEIQTQLTKINEQLNSSSPKKDVIKESLSTIRNLLEGVAGNFLASGIASQITQLLG
ncbi:hypothetical protein ABES38_08700 [Bacillus gobiensis]|uniref:AbiTii domain-containing protein n=1 Tax=Bacillus gobiensis TaxID=1441095 RepID=UPI003D2026EF